MANEYDQPGAGYWAANVGGGAASGALAGSAIMPGWGTVIGGVLGAGVGLAQGVVNNKKMKESWEQQKALEEDLSGRTLEQQIVQSGVLQLARNREAAVMKARASAAAAGLSPESTAALEARAISDADRNMELALPGLYSQAAQANLANRRQILDEYTTAQQLANNAGDQMVDYSKVMGAIAQGAQTYAAMKGAAGGAANTGAPAADLSTTEMNYAKSVAPWVGSYTPPVDVPAATDQMALDPNNMAISYSGGVGGFSMKSGSPGAGVSAGSAGTAGGMGTDAVSAGAAGATGGSTVGAATKGGSTGGAAGTGATARETASASPAPKPPPVGEANDVLPETLIAAQSGNADQLLSRFREYHPELNSDLVRKYDMWARNAREMGVPEYRITPDNYMNYVYRNGGN